MRRGEAMPKNKHIPDDPEAVEKAAKRGETLFNVDISQKAYQAFEDALKLRDQLLLADYDKARIVEIDAFQAVFSSPSSELPYRTYLALVWHYKHMVSDLIGRGEEASSAAENALICDPSFAEFWHQRGCEHENRGEYEEALKQFNTAIKYNAASIDAHLGRARALEAAGKKEESLASIDRAAACSPQNCDVWLKKGDVLADLNRLDEALDAYEKALELKPYEESALIRRAQTLEKIQKYDAALAAWDHISRQRQARDLHWYRRAILLRRLGHPEEAMEAFNHVLDECLQNPSLEGYEVPALIHKYLICSELASGILEEIKGKIPQGSALNLKKAEAFMEYGQYEQALILFNDLLREYPDDTWVLTLTVIALKELGRNEEAERFSNIIKQFEEKAKHKKAG